MMQVKPVGVAPRKSKKPDELAKQLMMAEALRGGTPAKHSSCGCGTKQCSCKP